jgi:CRP-like cAMP-binding protein
LIILLFLAVALGCGVLIIDRLRRPIHAILGVAEGSSREGLGEPDPQISEDPETRRLMLRVENLVQHRRAGARALSELEALERDADEITDSLRRAGDSRGLPALSATAQTSVRALDPLRAELHRFTQQLRVEMRAMDARLDRLEGVLGNGAAIDTHRIEGTDASLAALERLATVWSLRVEKARRDVPDLPGELGSCFRDFSETLERLRDSLHADGRGDVTVMDGARSEIAGLHETIANWLKDERGATQ